MNTCPCAGKVRSAFHDIERYRDDRDQHLSDVRKSQRLAQIAEENRRKVVASLALLQSPSDCSICGGSGHVSGNGSASIGGSGRSGTGAIHTDQKYSERIG